MPPVRAIAATHQQRRVEVPRVERFSDLERRVLQELGLRRPVHLSYEDEEGEPVLLGGTEGELAAALAQAERMGMDVLELRVIALLGGDDGASSEGGWAMVQFESPPSVSEEATSEGNRPGPASVESFTDEEEEGEAVDDEEPAAAPPAEVGEPAETLAVEEEALPPATSAAAESVVTSCCAAPESVAATAPLTADHEAEELDDEDFRTSFVRRVLAQPRAVAALVHALDTDEVRQAVAEAARDELDGTQSMMKHIMARSDAPMLLARAATAAGEAPGLAPFLHRFFSCNGEENQGEAEGKEKERHARVMCDGCEASEEARAVAVHQGFRDAQSGEILGVCYHSVATVNFDLCEVCEASGEFEDKGPFLKLRRAEDKPKLIVCVPQNEDLAEMGLDGVKGATPRELMRSLVGLVKERGRRAANASPAPEVPPVVPAVVPAVVEPPPEKAAPSSKAVEEECEVAYPVVPPVRVTSSVASCPNQHILTRFNAPHGNFVCNVCEKRQPPFTVLHSCRPCDFDVCQACLGTRLRPVATLAVVEPVPLVAAAPAPPAAALDTVPLLLPPVMGGLPQAKFVSDVSLHDGAEIVAGASVVKTWRVRNSSSSVTWPVTTRLLNVGGNLLGGPADGVVVPPIRPGDMVDISVPFVMPQQPGKYTSFWRLTTGPPTNARFGHRFWLMVTVVAPPVPSAPRVPTAPPVPTTTLSSRWPSPAQDANEVIQSEHNFEGVPQPLNDSSFDLAVSQIVEFGFNDVDRIVEVLRSVNNDTSRAIDRLLQEG